LIDRQNRVWNRMQEIQRASEKEDRDWTAEERANWDAAEVELTEVSGDIERLQRAAKMEAVDYADSAEYAAEHTAEVARVSPEEEATRAAAEYETAFGSYLRHGMEGLEVEQRKLLMANEQEIRAQSVSTTTAGGFLVPPGYRQVISETLKAYGGILNLCNVITTSTGNPLQWPTNDDTANVGAVLTENTQITSLDVVLGTRTLGAFVYTSKLVLVSYQLLQDSAFDLDTWLPKKLGQRLGRGIAIDLTTGAGTTLPLGVMVNMTVGKQGIVGQTLTIIYDDLVDLEHSVDPAYRTNAQYLMSDTMLKVIRKLKDTQGRPLWVPVPAPGFPATINGWRYSIDQGLAVPAASAKTLAFGDFNAGYIVRQVVDVQMVRLAERYADFLQVGFFGYCRLDGKPDDPAALRCYQQSAT
jgi:HK97 family phage major capsid protein